MLALESHGMSYYACFRLHEGRQFRLDTRIYLGDGAPGGKDICVAAIIGKNPGSASPTEYGRLSPINLKGDKLLPFVRNRFQNAYRMAGTKPSVGAFGRVWNLVYLCNKDLHAAVKEYQRVRVPLHCASEDSLPPAVWFAWGPPSPRLRGHSSRFMGREMDHPFYYDMDSERIIDEVPGQNSRVKHTQGMPAEPVEDHLASLINANASLRR
jgi:hypothetical protein